MKKASIQMLFKRNKNNFPQSVFYFIRLNDYIFAVVGLAKNIDII